LRVLPSDRGGRQLGKILEALALLRPKGDLPLEGLVEAQARHLPRGSTIVIVTPNTTNAIYRIADMLMRRGLRPVFVLVDAFTFGGKFSMSPVENQLQTLGVAFCVLQEGDDLTNILSFIVNSPVWH
jgi:uncharacterized protein (DUF58 family)